MSFKCDKVAREIRNVIIQINEAKDAIHLGDWEGVGFSVKYTGEHVKAVLKHAQSDEMHIGADSSLDLAMGDIVRFVEEKDKEAVLTAANHVQAAIIEIGIVEIANCIIGEKRASGDGGS